MTDLGARYGTSNRPRWFWPLIAAIGIIIGIALAAWVGFRRAWVPRGVAGCGPMPDGIRIIEVSQVWEAVGRALSSSSR